MNDLSAFTEPSHQSFLFPVRGPNPNPSFAPLSSKSISIQILKTNIYDRIAGFLFKENMRLDKISEICIFIAFSVNLELPLEYLELQFIVNCGDLFSKSEKLCEKKYIT